MLRFTSEGLDRFLLLCSTIACAIVTVPIINFFWVFIIDPIDNPLGFNESLLLAKVTIAISIICYLLAFIIFSRARFNFAIISIAGFVLSITGLLTAADLFTRFHKPWGHSQFWPQLGLSLTIGIVVSLGMMSIISVVRWQFIRFVSERRRLP